MICYIQTGHKQGPLPRQLVQARLAVYPLSCHFAHLSSRCAASETLVYIERKRRCPSPQPCHYDIE